MKLTRSLAACGLALVLLGSVTSPALAGPTYAFGPDGDGVGRVFGTVAPGAATPQATLGDGSVAYNGGLVYSSAASRFFAIGNDGQGNSSLVSFTAAAPGTFTLNQSLATGGFTGGLAVNGTTLYAVSTDFTGASFLYSMDLTGGSLSLLGSLSGALYTGLAYDADDGLLYGIAADASGVGRSVRRISWSGGVSDTELFQLGDGSVAFNGGLAYDDQADLFKVIANDGSAASTLMSFDLTGSSSLTALGASFGFGYLNAGLAIGPGGGTGGGGGGGGSSVPEPATPALLLALAIAWAGARRKTSAP
ncbi:MAG: PEP-CTERM sorting domain-containing protein [Burkholderiales bacterium]|nr:MAG: PEP-CTERM sorting domain-containing protein [Burkholderiales bacterium]